MLTLKSTPRGRHAQPTTQARAPHSCQPGRCPRAGSSRPAASTRARARSPDPGPSGLPRARQGRENTGRRRQDRQMSSPEEQERHRRKIQKQLDEALEASFPASDPVSIVTSQEEEDWGEGETAPPPPKER